MPTPFEVDHRTLHGAATDVRTTRTDVENELNKLLTVVDGLSTAWKGQASSGFQQLMQRWSDDTRKLQTALDNIADLLDQSGTAHQATDEEQQQMLNKFQSALNP